MTISDLRAPFPYFGGKRGAAPVVWARFGNPGAYIEPFCGSAAILLARPHTPTVETINDRSGIVTNFWRAVKHDPDSVAKAATGPVNELDMRARGAWVHDWVVEYQPVLDAEPDFYDATAAGYWLYVQNVSIGRASVNGSGPWVRTPRADGLHVLARKKDRDRPGVSRDIPNLQHGNTRCTDAEGMRDIMWRLHERLRTVRVASGDWTRVVKSGVLTTRAGGDGTTAVFLDPPYSTSHDLYDTHDKEAATVADDVREWCKTAPPDVRICLAGYDTDHDELLEYGWTKVTGLAGSSGYGKVAVDSRERLWFSPSCLEENTLF